MKRNWEANFLMRGRGINWHIWVGFALCLFAFLSYPFIFVDWPLTRDFPWANIILFVIAAILLFIGVRRAFGAERGWLSKIGASILAGFSALVLAGFIMVAFVASTWLPDSAGAPQIGQTAPDFTLTDTTGNQVTLAELRTTPIQPGSPSPRGVLLIFYRGYW